MKTVKPVELFLSLGLVATLGACGAPTPEGGEGSPEATTPTETVQPESSSPSEGGEAATTKPMDHGSEGGEGGEGGESGTAATDADADYMNTLSLMLGHMMIAKDLMAAGDYTAAEPHLGHPAEELYGSIEGQLGDRGVADFKDKLNAAHDLIKTAPKSPELETAVKEAITAIDEAINVLGADKLQSPEFVLATVNHMLKIAGEEYTAAIADGKIVEAVEYQDSRGFVLHSEMLYMQIADQLPAEQRAKLDQSFADLKAAWPSAKAPETPVKTPQEVLGLIVEIEANS